MLRWFGIGEGDEVILPAYTYSATANVVMHCGAKPVFVDVKDDINIDPNEIRKAINENTKVIMPVDFAGLPCDYDQLMAIVNDPQIRKAFNPTTDEQSKLGRILILADSAHAIGAEYKGKKLGSVTDLAVFSFHAVKNLSTAEGGAICMNLPKPFDNKAIYSELCIKSLHGQNKDALAKTQKGNWKYDIVEPGYKYNMTDIHASLGLVELRNYESDTLPIRTKICERYSELLSKYDWAELPTFNDDTRKSSYHLYPLRIKGVSEDQRDEIIQGIFDRDVSVNVHFRPVPMTSYYKSLGYNIHNYPKSYDLFSREISLPVFYDLTMDQVDLVVKAVVSAVSEVLEK